MYNCNLSTREEAAEESVLLGLHVQLEARQATGDSKGTGRGTRGLGLWAHACSGRKKCATKRMVSPATLFSTSQKKQVRAGMVWVLGMGVAPPEVKPWEKGAEGHGSHDQALS